MSARPTAPCAQAHVQHIVRRGLDENFLTALPRLAYTFKNLKSMRGGVSFVPRPCFFD